MSRTTEDLREFLFATLADVKAGKTTPYVANSIATISQQIVKTVELEIAYHRHVASHVKPGEARPDTRIALARRASNSADQEISHEPSGGRDQLAAIARRPV